VQNIPLATNKKSAEIMLNILERGVMEGNPMMGNLLNLARQNRTADIEQIARNICASQGIDYDKEFSSFKEGLFGSSKLKK
jgi:hypothetical protein